MYLRLSDNAYPFSEADIKALNPDTSFPAQFKHEDYVWVFPSPQPTYNQYTQQVTETAPVLTAKGHYEQAWIVTDLAGDDLANGLARQAEDIAKADAARIANLWQAAHDYEYAEISGSAVGLLAMGVMQAKPKCVAVQDWIKSIWTEYYTRKANGSTVTDYSICGACPHIVPELMAELGL